MRKVFRKSNLGKCILVLILFVSVFVFAGDVVVKEGVIEGVKFKSTGCTATGTKAVAFGDSTEASGDYSTAMGSYTEASGSGSTAMGLCTTAGGIGSTAMGVWATVNGHKSTAMGYNTTASGTYSTAVGSYTTASGTGSIAMGHAVGAGPANYTTAIGKSFTNNVQDSFAVGFGQKDFSVESGEVNVYGDLDVTGSYKANGTAGWSGWFDDGTNFRVTVTNGIITAVTDSVSGGHNP